MSEIEFYQTVVPIYLGALLVGVMLVVLFIDPISRWVEKRWKKRAKPA